MKNRKLMQVMMVVVIASILFACRHEILRDIVNNGGGGNGGGSYPQPVSNCSPDTAYFVNDVMPIIASNCTMSGCHDAVTHADGVNLTSYANVVRYVKPGNAGGSKLYKVLNQTGGDRMPPPPRAALTQAQKDIIAKWINQGAKNNSCVGACDTAVFTYSGAIKNTMTGKCVGCHNPNSLGGNIDLSTYNGVKAVAVNGKLYGSVAQTAGYSPMPKNSPKLSDCEIKQIQKWVNAGSPNN